ncbi:uncharacterized protein LOC110703699 [Chenopodium quinoa]|uniref:uncharacterized protein LOC110703699 n=1 Tax=Chenopodium quinoa TaxID=63459 RepID=UPI000B77809B|nr:uncharacterized protein LOC110703699 [Chenopodium quinoa]
MLSVDNVVQKLASLPFLGHTGIDAIGLSGGVFICWFTSLGLEPVFKSQNVFLCKLVQVDEIKYVMFVYGSPHVANQLEVWYLISSILDSISNVVIIGDFNQVEFFSDKLGGNFSIPGQLDFINWRMGLNLVDVPFFGPKYTWTNNRIDCDPIFERLDRAYGSTSWFANFPETHLIHQPILFSDHAAIILSDTTDLDCHKRPYRIELWCLSALEVHNIIASVFSLFFPGSPMFSLSRKLSVSRDRLLAWCISHKKAWGINWKQLVFEVSQASDSLCSRVDRCLFVSTKNEKVAQAQAAYMFWLQRAKIKWDAQGDSHSRLLFSSVQSRKRKNKILGLRDSTGTWHREPVQIASIISDFYQDLYTTSDTASSYDAEWWESLRLPTLSLDQRNFLMKPFSSEDIRSAIFSIEDSKSPGPDGFPSAFFKNMWDLVGSSVVSAVQHFFAHGYLLKDWNRTFLALLPKVDSPEVVSQFLPIGLCNVIYKCIAKCLTSLLRQVLPSLVADFQNAFVPGRLLLDNALIAHEALTYVNTWKAKKKFFASIKLDMNKAYDRVNWVFLFRLLQAYGFSPYWIQIIRQCVSTVSFQVLVNGNPLKAFQPQCGLRQGDPLSSYLFVLCMEVLSAMLRRGERSSLFKGIKISRGAPSISHLFFADDSLLFLEVNPDACANLMTLLSEFCSLSGHVISLQKSAVKFSPNTPTDYRDFLARSLKLQVMPSLGSYLGLPKELSLSKVADFGFLIDKVVQCLSCLASLRLSSAAKLVIINSILVASFNHILSVFKVPSSICATIDNLLARFWWKSDPHSRGLVLRSKTLLHLPKGMGGLGIRRLDSFNSALLARQCWRIQHNPQLLVSRLLFAKYPSLRYVHTKSISGSSWGCRGLLQGLSALSKGIAWKVGSGSRVHVLEDAWVPGEPLSFRNNCEMPLPSHVSSIINPRSYAWDMVLVHRLFDSSTSNRILALERPTKPMDDFVYWKFSRDGNFSTKSAYAMMLRQFSPSDGMLPFSFAWWKVFWKLPILPKLQCFCWKFLHNALPLFGTLQAHGIPVDSTYVLCHNNQETVDHLFRDCSFINSLWSANSFLQSLMVRGDKPFSVWFVDKVLSLRRSKSWEALMVLISFLWAIWIARNHKIFRQAVISPAFIFLTMQDWTSRGLASQDNKSSSLVPSIGSRSRVMPDTKSSCFSCCFQGSGDSSFGICLVFDGAFNAHDNAAGAGWVFRRPSSDVVIGGGSRAFLSSSALHSELQALLWALRSAGHRGFRRVVRISPAAG